MMWLSAARVFKMGLKNFWRNIWISLATTGIMVLTIFSIALLIILNIIADVALTSLEQKIDVSVYFKSEVTAQEIQPIQDQLEAMQEVKSVTYVSKDQALEEFKQKHGDNQLIISSLSELEENPLQPTLVVKAHSAENYAAISEVLQDEAYAPIVQKFNYEDNQGIIDKLNRTTKTLERVGIAISAGFAFISVLVMFNTIRLTIYTQKEEISIMRLVGASNTFILVPYIIEGILYGFFATIISTVILYFSLNSLAPMINNFLENQADIFSYFTSNLFVIIALQLAFGIFLGIFSSLIAIRRYLKV